MESEREYVEREALRREQESGAVAGFLFVAGAVLVAAGLFCWFLGGLA